MEILTAQEVAALLKISKRQVYESENAQTRTGEADGVHHAACPLTHSC